MNTPPSLEFYAKFFLGTAALLLLPALWSFVSAIISAADTGYVLVISIGRTATAREMVPWANGWPRFVAPPVLLTSLVLWASSSQLPRSAWWSAAAMATAAQILLLFSLWFSSWRGILWFAGLVAFIFTALYVGNRFGRLSALAFVLLVSIALLWRLA